MLSACFARLLSFLAGLRLQLLISTQFDEKECLAWGNSLQNISNTDSSLPDIKPILSRLLDDPSFGLDALRHNTVSSGIIGFTSAVEYYLQDIIVLALRRNSGLRKKGFSGIQISALELEQETDLIKIKNKIIRSLGSEYSKGGVFSNKIKKLCSFLAIEPNAVTQPMLKSLDSVWRLRNEFAHVNQSSIETYSLLIKDVDKEFRRPFSKNDYFKLIVSLIEIIDESRLELNKVDSLILTKWSADSFE
jgi:hypothetical protein